MRIEFPLMSILSIAFLAFFLIIGGTPEIHSIEVGFLADLQGITITIDPTIVVWSDLIYPATWLGETFGNVSVINRKYKGTQVGRYIERFELNHIKQFRALGWFSYPAGLILPIDPVLDVVHWSDITEPDKVEWLPPAGWPDAWHFLTVTLAGK